MYLIPTHRVYLRHNQHGFTRFRQGVGRRSGEENKARLSVSMSRAQLRLIFLSSRRQKHYRIPQYWYVAQVFKQLVLQQ